MERKGDDGGTGPRRQRGVRDKGEGDGRTEEQGQGGKRNGKQKDRRTEKKGKGKGRQKDKRTEEQKDKRTKTGGKGNRKKGARGPEKARKLSPAALEQCSSYPVALLRSCWRNFTEGVGNYAGTHGTMPFCRPRKIFSAFCLADIKKTDTFATLLESTGV